MTSANSIVCIVSKLHAKMLRICQMKVLLFKGRYHGNRTTYFLRQAKIGQQGSKAHFDTCRSFLHDGRIKLLI